MPHTLTYAQAINEALHQAMELDSNVICYGLGTDDPKGVFGTTLGLQERFGEQRVFDIPTAENAMTGIAIGASLNRIRPVVTHQRLDFFLLAMDQLVNNAAKWRYMFGGQSCVPITLRLILGRGWGQGPTHSQNLQAWFSHVPGLKVVMPTTPADAKGTLLTSIFDNNPVVFLEHRWLHGAKGDVPEGDYRVPLGEAARVRDGDDLTIVSLSYMTIEAISAIDRLQSTGASCDLIDVRTIKPMDWEAVFGSVRKTGRLLVLDTASETGSFAGEIIARVTIDCFDKLKDAPRRLALPDVPTPTSLALTESFYNRSEDILLIAADMLGLEVTDEMLGESEKASHDVPDSSFKGPF